MFLRKAGVSKRCGRLARFDKNEQIPSNTTLWFRMKYELFAGLKYDPSVRWGRVVGAASCVEAGREGGIMAEDVFCFSGELLSRGRDSAPPILTTPRARDKYNRPGFKDTSVKDRDICPAFPKSFSTKLSQQRINDAVPQTR